MSIKSLLIGSTLVICSCASGQESSPSTVTDPVTTVATTTSTSTTTTVPKPGGNLDVHIDPAIESLPETQQALEMILRTEQQYYVRPGTVTLLYGTDQTSVDWAFQKAKELNCFQDIGINGFVRLVGWGRPCGLMMRVDGVNYDCFDDTWCKQGRTVAAHEFYHVVAYQVLENCTCEPRIFGQKIPNWLNEGITDYVGYAMVYGATPGSLDRNELLRLRTELKTRATNSAVAVGVIAMEDLWSGGSAEPWFQYLYDRSFLAVTLLVERFGEQAVIVEYFENVTALGNHEKGFEETFGIAEAEFDAEFQAWIKSL